MRFYLIPNSKQTSGFTLLCKRKFYSKKIIFNSCDKKSIFHFSH